ncbi:hypothetical protein BDK92_7174 [Micromonospora pisi]|uniref:Uncharacterized protein n=1 Tax=Micromonospora pisi TaxID=589240 RepID=A0A495JUK2_9ACTN|nr:hypothetical protein [Micromonospora pisi]RKR92696.1 hypothetical protein BDK92_7174 [Micromonospora pisi]
MTTTTTERVTPTSSPVEIDTHLHRLYIREMQATQRLMAANISLHRANGETPVHLGRRQEWPTSDADALAACRAKVAAPDYKEVPWGSSPTKAIAALTAATADLAAIEAEAASLEAEWVRRGRWTRYFTVQQHDGHIHSSMNCSTCNRGMSATRFTWNPDLSGLTEAEAVAKLGPNLCTVCFPSAPVEWTRGADTDAVALADGWCLNRVPTDSNYNTHRPYGRCNDCDARNVPLTQQGLRKHKHERNLTEAARKARREDPKLIGTPEGDELRVDRETIKTVVAAKNRYVWHMEWVLTSRNPAFAADHAKHAATIAEALAAKLGKRVDEIRAELQPRVTKMLKAYGR